MSHQWDELRNDIQRRDSPSILMWCADVLELLDERDKLEALVRDLQSHLDTEGKLANIVAGVQEMENRIVERQRRAIEVLMQSAEAHERFEAERILKGEE